LEEKNEIRKEIIQRKEQRDDAVVIRDFLRAYDEESEGGMDTGEGEKLELGHSLHL